VWWAFSGFHPFGGLFFLLFVASVLFLLFSMRRNGWSYRADDAGRAEAEAILRRRLATGEINEAEYRSLRDVLYR